MISIVDSQAIAYLHALSPFGYCGFCIRRDRIMDAVTIKFEI